MWQRPKNALLVLIQLTFIVIITDDRCLKDNSKTYPNEFDLEIFGDFFHLSDVSKTWTEAFGECKAKGGRLTTIFSAREDPQKTSIVRGAKT